jgi:putative AlgH/UPF0301 family transcriptional regulator
MSLRKRFLFVMLFTAVALAADGRGSVYRAESLRIQFKNLQLKNPQDLGVGKVLVAARNLGDPNFAGTVILLVHYDGKGAVGVILNRRTDVPLSRVLNLNAAKDRSDPIYLGGPVEPTVVSGLFASPAKVEKAENVFGGVYLISDKALFEKTISGRPDPGVFHVYLGYAGWSQDQLRSEVQLGAWFIFPADTATVFNPDPDSLWLEMIKKTQLRYAKAEPFAESSQQKDRLIGAGPSDRNGWEKSRASSGRVGLKAVRGEPQNTKWVSFLGERGSSCERIPFVAAAIQSLGG